MTIEPDAQEDLSLDDDDAENVAAGKGANTLKAQSPSSGLGSVTEEPPGPSPDALEWQ